MDLEELSFTLIAGADTGNPTVWIIEEDDYSVWIVIGGLVGAAAIPVVGAYLGAAAATAASTVWAGAMTAGAMTLLDEPKFKDGNDDIIGKSASPKLSAFGDFGGGLELDRVSADEILNGGADCIPTYWENDSRYSINSVDGVELYENNGYRKASIRMRYESTEEFDGNDPAVYYITYYLRDTEPQ